MRLEKWNRVTTGSTKIVMSELSLFNSSDLLVAFSEKKDGSMHDEDNRRKFLKSLGIEPEQLVIADLVHGDRVQVVEQVKGDVPQTDALLTGEENLFLGATFADCLPIFIYHPQQQVVGLVHGGWRGLAKNILKAVARKLRNSFGVKLNQIEVGIGPGICKEHYQVRPEVIEEFEKFPETYQQQGEKFLLDLRKVAVLQLVNLGVEEDNIEVSSECTYELTDKYFSFRRDENDSHKRMLGVIGRAS